MRNKHEVNINCDLGEGMLNDEQLMPMLSSCNIACGGHYGDENTIRETIKLAQKYGVHCGAHPSYPDRLNFGRKVITLSTDELIISLRNQIELFQKIANEEKCDFHHIKLHGALYNQAANDQKLAQIILTIFEEFPKTIRLYVPSGSLFASLAKKNHIVCEEAFIDRTYQDDLSLTPRSAENALIKDPETAWKQLKSILNFKKVLTISGKQVALSASTFCIHGDSENALEILTYISNRLNNE
jgi:UPF0271 protein